MARKHNPNSRDFKAGDDVYNARRRFKRAAERYERDAAKASPIEAARLKKQAEYMRSQAELTYKGKDNAVRMEKRIKYSFSTLEGARKDVGKRRDIEAHELMKTDIGAKIYGATVSIWQDSKYSNRDVALMEYFGVSDLMGVIEKFESEFGEKLYSKDFEPNLKPSEALALASILAFDIR